MKKSTLKDIAKLANVSVATVSYILNNVKNQTIPDETKYRVLDIAKQLNYVPNLTAKSLARGKTDLIGILVNRDQEEGFWKTFYYHELINQLEKLLTERGYHVVVCSVNALNPRLDVIAERKLDGAFLIDVKKEVFHTISKTFPMGVPLVIIDSYIQDNLFHKILFNFADAIGKAKEKLSITDDDFILITDSYHNKELTENIKEVSALEDEHIYLMESEEGLAHFLKKHSTKKTIIINEFIGAMACKYIDPSKLAVLCTCHCPSILPLPAEKILFRNKASVAFDLMMKHLHNQMLDISDKYIFIKAD